MKIAEETNTIVRSGEFKEQGFTIKASAKAFAILSEGLYSDKVLAIVRELSTNAYDSHVMAGTQNKPFTIHLPNTLEKYFSIRDYGVGLSKDDIFNVYTKYFESDKTDSNDYVGCLGLGSKSPFSYTDSFTVVSFYNGKKFTYNAYINEEQLPTIALMNEQKTDEDNGLEVIVNVKQQDIYEFCNKAELIYKYFDCPINITGSAVTINKPKYEFKTTRFGAVKRDRWGSSDIYGIMGNVAYKIDLNKLDHQIRNTFMSLGSFNIFLKIGEVEITASREAISYTKGTIQSLNKIFKDVEAELRKYVDDKLASCTTMWEAAIVFNSLWRYSGLNRATWAGKDVTPDFKIPTGYDVSRYTKHNNSYYNNGYKISQAYGVSSIRPNSKTIFVLNDIKTGAVLTTKALLKDNTFETAFLVKEEDKQLFTDLDIPESTIYKASDYYAKPNRAGNTGGSTGIRKAKVFEFTNSGQRASTTYWKDATVTPNQAIKDYDCYVVITNYKLISSYRDFNDFPRNCTSGFSRISVILDREIKLIGVKDEKPFKQAGMLSLDEFITTKLVDYFKQSELESKFLRDTFQFHDTIYSRAVEKIATSSIVKMSDLMAKFRKEKARVQSILTNSNRITEIKWLEGLGIKIPEKKVTHELTNLLGEVESKYPLLSAFSIPSGLSQWDNTENKNIRIVAGLIQNYITECDKV